MTVIFEDVCRGIGDGEDDVAILCASCAAGYHYEERSPAHASAHVCEECGVTMRRDERVLKLEDAIARLDAEIARRGATPALQAQRQELHDAVMALYREIEAERQ